MKGVRDITAERLEAAKLWRRAASRWLEVMLIASLNDEQREWLRQRRKFCTIQAAYSVRLERFEVAEITRAATATQIRMGISKPRGEAFRLVEKPTFKRQKTIYKPVADDSDDNAINALLKIADINENSE